MAIFSPGLAIGQISGRVGGSVYSHNRGGAYIRNGAIPVKVVTDKALNLKAATTAAVQAWSGLSAASRLQWDQYAKANPSVNRLGKVISTTGQNAYVGLNSRLLYAGSTAIAIPPIDAAPAGIVITGFTVDAGTGDTQIVFTPDPLETGLKLWVRGCVVMSAAKNNIQNLLTTVVIGGATTQSPLDIETELVANFGSLIVGASYHVECRVLDPDTGKLSGPAYASAICADSP
jgi:hypothetical protein